jgi:hypothetical protein
MERLLDAFQDVDLPFLEKLHGTLALQSTVLRLEPYTNGIVSPKLFL